MTKSPWWVYLILFSLGLIFAGSLALNAYFLTRPNKPGGNPIVVTNNILLPVPLPATNDVNYAWILELNRYRTEAFQRTNFNSTSSKLSLVDRWAIIEWTIPIYKNLITFSGNTTSGFSFGYSYRFFESIPFYLGPSLGYNPWSTNVSIGINGSVLF